MKGEWERSRFAVAYAYTRISDALLRSPATLPGITSIDDLPIGQVRNVESATYHSVEASVLLPIWRRLSLSAAATYTRGSLKAPAFSPDPAQPTPLVEQPANKVPPPFGRVALSWRSAGGRFFSEAALRFALAQDRLGEIDLTDTRICPDSPGTCQGTPAWAALSLRAGLRLTSSVRMVTVLENLTDARYRLHASGINAPGRSFVVMLEGYL
jgi:hemoglobin/transferrin/lactoferrin receptor protein